MKITIDDVNKTITVEDESVSIANLLKFLKERKIDINEYKLIPTEEVIYYYPEPSPLNPCYPENPIYPWVTYDINTSDTDFGIFN